MNTFTAITLSLTCLASIGTALAGDSITETEKVVPSGGMSNDSSGWSISMDGDLMAIGSPKDNTTDGGGDAGSVTVIDAEGNEHLLTASNAGIYENFGYSVNVHGNLLITGAPLHPITTREGAAYIFRRGNDGTWVEEAQLVAPGGQWSDFFGCSVAISNTTAVVGAYLSDVEGPSSGTAWVFEYDGCCDWELVQRLVPSSPTVKFGTSVAIGDERIIVGSPRDNIDGLSAGSAYVFHLDRSDNEWEEEQRLVGSDTAAFDYFGYAVDLNVDGDLAVVGAIYNDAAAPNAGAAYVYRRSRGDDDDDDDDDDDGDDDEGDDDDGDDDDGDGSWFEQEQLVPSGDEAWQKFGSSVSIDGSRAAIGCYGYPDSPGHGYLYEETTEDGWVEVIKFVTTDGENGARVGYKAALSGSNVLLGAPWQDNEAGAAYYYDLDRATQSCDLNFDGRIDIFDLLVVLRDWGECPDTPAPCSGDADRNERVDVLDLLAVLESWI